MQDAHVNWPRKTREVRTAVMDSTRWDGFRFRDGDIVIDTWSKAGTTLTQQIVGQLIFQGREGLSGPTRTSATPWLDMTLIPLPVLMEALEAQTHRRFIKSHLPLDALVYSPRAKYLYIARDARDVMWSMHNHHLHFTPGVIDAFNALPGRPERPLEPITCSARDYYLCWLEHDKTPGFEQPSFWDHVKSWWECRHLPNLLLVHFNQLTSDLPGSIRRIARFLDIAIDEAAWPAILEHCGLDYMRREATKDQEMNMVFQGGAATFFNKGTNGRWRDVLTAEEIARCDEIAAKRLPPDCAHWLKTGELPK